MKIFDCDIAYGLGTTALMREIASPQDLLTEMDHCGIDQALVYHRDAWERDCSIGNQRLAELAEQPRLHPAVAFTPTCCEDMLPVDDFMANLQKMRARAVRAFPAKNSFLLDRVSCGDLLEAFIAQSVPLLVPLAELGWNAVYGLLRDFPALKLIVTQTGIWGHDRFFRPLMRQYPGFCITTDRLEIGGQLKSLVDRFGYSQVLFGSGLPQHYPGGYVMMLARADITDEAREAIAHKNIERILGEVAW